MKKYPEIVNLKEDYNTFYKSELSPTISLWEREIESKHSEYYKNVIFKAGSDPLWEAKRKESFNLFLSAHKKYATEILKEFTLAKETLLGLVPKFFEVFPDADFSDNRIYLVPSLLRFNGQGALFEKQMILSFGIDFIVTLDKEPDYINGLSYSYSSGVFYAHELFHLYHYKHFKNDMNIEKTLLIAAWEEGLATYVSELFNKDASLANILMDEHLAKKIGDSKTLISKFKLDMNKSDNESYKKWFLVNSDNKVIPKRAGYLVGYLFAKELSKKYSVSELSKLTGSEVKKKFENYM